MRKGFLLALGAIALGGLSVSAQEGYPTLKKVKKYDLPGPPVNASTISRSTRMTVISSRRISLRTRPT